LLQVGLGKRFFSIHRGTGQETCTPRSLGPCCFPSMTRADRGAQKRTARSGLKRRFPPACR
jgi:hypothetical protein